MLLLLCVSVPSFMINLDSNIVAVSLDTIGRSLRTDFAAMEWVISAYTLTFAAFVMPAGSLADLFGRKRLLLLGLAVFTLSSLACGAAGRVEVLTAARAIQGIGAALQLSAALAILSHSFAGRERARAFAFWGSVIGVAIALGPVLGGLITQMLGWEWAFYINVPIGLALIPLCMAVLSETRDPHALSIDIAGVVTFSGMLFLLTLALIEGGHRGWSDKEVWFELMAAAVLALAFVLAERRQARPMMDLSVFRKPTFVGGNLASLGFAAAVLTMLTYIPLYFQGSLGESPRAAGLRMLPLALPLVVVPRIVSRRLAHILDGRTLLVSGLFIAASGLGWLAFVAGWRSYAAMLFGMLVCGVGAGILNGETAKVAMSVIPPERAGMASGVGGTVRFTGILLGFAALGTFLFHGVSMSVDHAAIPDGLKALVSQRIASGDPGAVPIGVRDDLWAALAPAAYAHGIQLVLLAAATFAAVCAVGSWMLVRPEDAPAVTLGDVPAQILIE